MTDENLNQEEEVLDTTPANGSESDDALDLESLFADESQEESEDDEVTQLKKKVENIEKGVRKYFSDKGRTEKQDVPVKQESNLDDVSELFFAQVPQAEGVQDDLKKIADAKYNGSILKAWRGESWLQEKATALDNAKKEDEVNRSKIDRPSSGSLSKRNDFSHIKTDDDVAKLSSAQRAAFLKHQAEKGN